MIVDLQSALKQFVFRQKGQLKGNLPFAMKPQVWFIVESQELPESHQTLLQQAVSQGLKLLWESDVRVLPLIVLNEELNRCNGPHPWIVFLGLASDKSMLSSVQGKRFARTIQTESIDEVLSSSEKKKKFWNDIKVIKSA